jgi:hypothetical protein
MLATYFHHVHMYELSLLIIALPLTLSASVNVVLDIQAGRQNISSRILNLFSTFPL